MVEIFPQAPPPNDTYMQQYLPQINTGLQPPPPQDDFFKYRLESLDILDTIEHQLRGEVKVNGVYKQLFDRWMNEEGINKVLHIVYSCGINKNIFLGNLTHEQINLKCLYLKTKLARLIFDKYKDYGIDKEMRGLIIETIKNQIHSGLSRCEMGKEADQLSTASQRTEVYHQGGEQKQPSMLNPLNWIRRAR